MTTTQATEAADATGLTDSGEAAADGVPGRAARIGRHDDDARLLGGGSDPPQHPGAALRGAVQEYEKWQGTGERCAGHLNDAVAFGPESKRAGLQ